MRHGNFTRTLLGVWKYENLTRDYIKASNDLVQVQNDNHTFLERFEKRRLVEDGDRSSST